MALAAGPVSEGGRSSTTRLGRFHRAGFLTARYHQALASTQQNSATQVAANRQGTAVASGREIDSPSRRPGPA